jgi:hypothetical protein
MRSCLRGCEAERNCSAWICNTLSLQCIPLLSPGDWVKERPLAHDKLLKSESIFHGDIAQKTPILRRRYLEITTSKPTRCAPLHTPRPQPDSSPAFVA